MESLHNTIKTRLLENGTLFAAFERAAFGTLSFSIKPCPEPRTITVHLGEKLDPHGRLDRNPPGTIRYRRIEQTVEPDTSTFRLIIPTDKRNTGPAAIKMPSPAEEVFPFRYAEIENAVLLIPNSIRQIATHCQFDDEAAHFNSSSNVLNAVWDLCKYTIKATTFCGIYVDGDRERIPYEGDAFINQLCHYGVDHEYEFARRSHEYMIARPTWPTEWHLHSVMMAWADCLYTGETGSLEKFYEQLRAKTLIDFARGDGLISTAPELRTPEMTAKLEPHFESGIIKRDIRDLVDWPPGSFTSGGTGERDNHDMLPVNTVVNAFHAHALHLMTEIASAIGRRADSKLFSQQAEKVKKTINTLLFDSSRGIYIDGEGSTHASLHSNMFMLAFGLVPANRIPSVLAFIKSRGMACSVYGSQHLLDALYMQGESSYALDLMTATHDRSWWNMIEAGSTMTLEAWDIKYKNNLDWNHAWGAAPANIIPRYVLGVRPLTPGFAKTLIQPQPGTLTHASGKAPTIRGPIKISLRNEPGTPFVLKMDIPDGISATAGIPRTTSREARVLLNGKPVQARPCGETLFLDDLPPGRHTVEQIL